MKKNILKLALLGIGFYFVANSVTASEEAVAAGSYCSSVSRYTVCSNLANSCLKSPYYEDICKYTNN